jgi:hypothetical protein
VDAQERISSNLVRLKQIYVFKYFAILFIFSAVFYRVLWLILLAQSLTLGAILLHFEEHSSSRRSFWPVVGVIIIFQPLLVYFDVLCTFTLISWWAVTQVISHAVVFSPPPSQQGLENEC